MEVPAESDIKPYVAIAYLMFEGESKNVRTVGIACYTFAGVDARCFSIIACINVIKSYSGTELEMIAIHGCKGGRK